MKLAHDFYRREGYVKSLRQLLKQCCVIRLTENQQSLQARLQRVWKAQGNASVLRIL